MCVVYRLVGADTPERYSSGVRELAVKVSTISNTFGCAFPRTWMIASSKSVQVSILFEN